jgi:hypothetical protein
MKREFDEEAGIKAIIMLQAMAGINESREDALKGWRKMSDSEKENTMAAFDIFKDMPLCQS